MAKVVLENLVKIYHERNGPGVRAVDQINLTIEDREFMVLVGPSGCGKSTTLRMIAGLEEASAGNIVIAGRVVNQVPPKDRDLAMVFQNYALYPHMSVYDNMAFALKLRRLPRDEIDVRVRTTSALLGLDPCLLRKPRALSGGQRQRVALGRASVRQPQVFLFDEPLSNLDARMRVAMRTEISRLHTRLATTMIYVTHDQVEAMTMGDRICVMKDGSIMQVAEPLTLYHHPENMFVAGFIGSPPMNLFQGSIRRHDGHLAFVEAGGDTPLTLRFDEVLSARAAEKIDQPVCLGIRPENVGDRPGPDDAPPGCAVELKIEVAEPMGAETYLHCDTGAHPLIARVRPSGRFEAGQRVRLVFDLTHAHLFDPATGRVLR